MESVAEAAAMTLRAGAYTTLRAGAYTASVSQLAGAVVSLRNGERDLLCHDESIPPMPPYRGAVLAPWPNRIADGRYCWGGREHQLSVNEPNRGCALHGLLLWSEWRILAATQASVELAAAVEEQPGYPWKVAVTMSYELDAASGLRAQFSARNDSVETVPFGVSIHPYLTPGAGSVDDWTLSIDAKHVIDVDPARLLPRATIPVEEAGLDFRGGRLIGARAIDHAFTGLVFDDAGLARATLTDGAGRGVEIEWDDRCGWIQVHTTDIPGHPLHRRGLALEPMSCPPDAFNSAVESVALHAEDERGAVWRISAFGDAS
jgi:aldose 1-epimerase